MRVSNTQLSQVSYWDLDKFEARLEQMRELYMVRSHTPDTNSKQTLANTFRLQWYSCIHVCKQQNTSLAKFLLYFDKGV